MSIFVKAYKNLVYQSRKTNLKIEIAFYHLLFIISCVPLKTWYDLLTAIPKTPTITYALVNTIALFSLPIIIPTATLIGSWSLFYYLQEIMKLSKEKYKATIFVTITLILDLISIAIAIQYSIIPIALSFWIIQGLFIIALFELKN
jgi:hypothetical protein